MTHEITITINYNEHKQHNQDVKFDIQENNSSEWTVVSDLYSPVSFIRPEMTQSIAHTDRLGSYFSVNNYLHLDI